MSSSTLTVRDPVPALSAQAHTNNFSTGQPSFPFCKALACCTLSTAAAWHPTSTTFMTTLLWMSLKITPSWISSIYREGRNIKNKIGWRFVTGEEFCTRVGQLKESRICILCKDGSNPYCLSGLSLLAAPWVAGAGCLPPAEAWSCFTSWTARTWLLSVPGTTLATGIGSGGGEGARGNCTEVGIVSPLSTSTLCNLNHVQYQLKETPTQ